MCRSWCSVICRARLALMRRTRCWEHELGPRDSCTDLIQTDEARSIVWYPQRFIEDRDWISSKANTIVCLFHDARPGLDFHSYVLISCAEVSDVPQTHGICIPSLPAEIMMFKVSSAGRKEAGCIREYSRTLVRIQIAIA